MFIGSCEFSFSCFLFLGGFDSVFLGYLCSKCILLTPYVGFGFSRYYEGGVSSVYFWDLDDGFAGVVLLKKSESDPQIEVTGWEVDVGTL